MIKKLNLLHCDDTKYDEQDTLNLKSIFSCIDDSLSVFTMYVNVPLSFCGNVQSLTVNKNCI